jgi:2-(1,2-epoxy-1,2-dihydrophenyl)acetyl-CoA isomerase
MESSSDPVLFDVADGIARVRFNRPDALNAIDVKLAHAFVGICEQIASRKDVRVVVMSGEGRGFMAGGDVAGMVEAMPRPETFVHALLDALDPAFRILTQLSAPVIASVHGPVAGAGVSTMLAADLAIAADDTKITLAYTGIGATADATSTWSLPRVVGLRRALEIALLNDLYSASEALAMGLVNKVVPRAELAAATDKIAARLAAGPTQAYGRMKNLLRGSLEHTMEEQMQLERAAFVECSRTSDFVEGTSAFLAKRRPKFTGA